MATESVGILKRTCQLASGISYNLKPDILNRFSGERTHCSIVFVRSGYGGALSNHSIRDLW